MSLDAIGDWIWYGVGLIVPVAALAVAHRKGWTRKAPTAEPDRLPKLMRAADLEAQRIAELQDYRDRAERLVASRRSLPAVDPTPAPPPVPPSID